MSVKEEPFQLLVLLDASAGNERNILRNLRSLMVQNTVQIKPSINLGLNITITAERIRQKLQAFVFGKSQSQKILVSNKAFGKIFRFRKKVFAVD